MHALLSGLFEVSARQDNSWNTYLWSKKKQINVVLPVNSTYLNLVEAEVKKMDQQQEQLQVGKVKVHG